MNTAPTPQERMDTSFDNYLALSEVLRSDVWALYETESDSQHWRRNFVRSSAVLIEGYSPCIREICAVGLECVAPEISKEEAKVVKSERGFDANERIKLTLRAAYKLFELELTPNFEGHEWPCARRVIEKRHLLMHPQKPADLDVPNELWLELRDGVEWLLKQHFDFIAAIEEKYGDRRRA